MNETVETPGTPMPDTTPPQPGEETQELPPDEEEGERYDGGDIPAPSEDPEE